MRSLKSTKHPSIPALSSGFFTQDPQNQDVKLRTRDQNLGIGDAPGTCTWRHCEKRLLCQMGGRDGPVSLISVGANPVPKSWSMKSMSIQICKNCYTYHLIIIFLTYIDDDLYLRSCMRNNNFDQALRCGPIEVPRDCRIAEN